MNSKIHDIGQCVSCGQDRSYPTRPGKWKYKEVPDFLGRNQWVVVDVIAGPEDGDLGIIPEGQGEPVWWPKQAIWKKL